MQVLVASVVFLVYIKELAKLLEHYAVTLKLFADDVTVKCISM